MNKKAHGLCYYTISTTSNSTQFEYFNKPLPLFFNFECFLALLWFLLFKMLCSSSLSFSSSIFFHTPPYQSDLSSKKNNSANTPTKLWSNGSLQKFGNFLKTLNLIFLLLFKPYSLFYSFSSPLLCFSLWWIRNWW